MLSRSKGSQNAAFETAARSKRAGFEQLFFLGVSHGRDVEDFRYFLPRILEISATTPGWWPSPEVVLGKLKLAAWRSWPKRERAAVETFLLAWFDALIDAILPGADYCWDPSTDPLDVLVCGLARAEFDLDVVQDRLLSHPAALNAVSELNLGDVWGAGRLTNAFWEDVPEARDRMVAFLKSEAVQEVLTKPPD